MTGLVGWDIGAANVKAAWLARKGNAVQVTSQPFEIWREKNRLAEVLCSVLDALSPSPLPELMAVTMTAELSDVFATKREGVLHVVECLRTCFPAAAFYFLNVSGKFVPPGEAQAVPLDVAATNWLASALWVSRIFPNCLVVDVGSTTTDIIPILDGQVRAAGRTDMERLSVGELVYTGVLRTNLAAIVQSVPIRGYCCRVSSEYFAISGDVHLVLGNLTPQDYTCTTADGHPPSIESARRRLARLVCADTEMLAPEEIDEMARHIYESQVSQVCDGIAQVIARLPRLRNYPVLLLGAGAFLGSVAVQKMGLKAVELGGTWRREVIAAAPCVAAAHLLADHLNLSHGYGHPFIG